MAVKITSVEPHSAAEKAGLKAGMLLLSINGHLINDRLDYEFYSTAAQLDIVAENGAEPKRYHVEKDEYQPLGCEFDSYLIDSKHHCKNNCIFCFVSQLPKDLRKPLYFKDDDERLGFLFGNYITLTNLGDKEIQRIIDMRISPINISVHTANPQLRVDMMGNPNAGKVLEYIPRLAKAGINLNFQLVLCPSINDGKELEKSVEWLAGLGETVQSIAAVPVGVTRHRAGLTALKPYTLNGAAQQLDIMLRYGERFLEDRGQRLVFPSDEWFLLAERPLPPDDFYEDYAQLANGVGMWRLFHDEAMAALQEHKPDKRRAIHADVATGVLAAPLFAKLIKEITRHHPRAHITLHVIENDFFGHTITVAGLLTGQDIINQCQGKLTSKHLLLTDAVLRSEGDLMLDDTTPAELQKALDTQLHFVEQDGAAFIETILEIE